MSLFNGLDYDTRQVALAPGPAPREDRLFSSSTEAMDWQQVWCYQCVRDHSMHGADPEGPGCQIYLDEMMNVAKRHEIVEHVYDEHGCTRAVCNAFVQCDEDGCQEGPDPELRATKADPATPMTYRAWCAQQRAACGPFVPVIPYEEDEP